MRKVKNLDRMIGNNVRRIRVEKGLTRPQLADLAGTKEGYIEQIENGNGPGKEMMLKLSTALGVQIMELFHDPDKPLAPPGQIPLYTDSGAFVALMASPPLEDRCAYGVEIRDDAMAPRYVKGEVVIASPAAEVESGDYVAAKLVNGRVMVRKMKNRGDIIILTPLNHDFEAWACSEKDLIEIDKIIWHK